METIKFKQSWCDYLTPCPHKDGVMLGDYDCEHCKHCEGIEITHDNIGEFSKNHTCNEKDYYKRYSLGNDGIVKCNFKTK